MKLAFFLAFVGFAAAATLRPEVRIPSDNPKVLVYLYDAQVATGVQEVSDDYSTVRMQFKAVMRAKAASGSASAQRWVVEFEEANVRQRLNATGSQPKLLLPMSQFRNLENSQQWFSMEQSLKKQFEVEIDPDTLEVTKVFFSNEDPFWSVNVKKGFLQSLQLNFDNSNEALARSSWISEIDQMTTADKCKTRYVANAIRDRDSGKKQFSVEKVIDFNNCRSRLNDTKMQTGLWSGVSNANPLQQLKQKRIIEVTNLANYQVEILSRVNQPIIKEAAIRTIYTMTPFGNAEHGAHNVIAIQQLQLLRAEKSDAAVTTDSDLTESLEGLRLLFPQEVEVADKEILQRRVQQLMSQLVKGADSEIDMEVYEQVLRIVRFHLTQQTDLEQIAESLRSGDKAQQKLRVFILDLCPQIGSAESVQFLMKVVRDLLESETSGSFLASAKLTVNHIQPIFVKLGLNGNVQLDMIKAVFETVKSSQFKNQLLMAQRLPIFKSGWLCLGAMMNAFYGAQAGVEPFMLRAGAQSAQHFTEEETILAETRANLQKQSSELRRTIVQTIRSDMLTGERSDVLLNLGLQVLKNAGLFETYEDVSRVFLSQWTRKTKQRVQAIYATQKMLQRVTLPRFFSKDERSDSAIHRQIRPREEVESHFAQLAAKIETDLIRTFRNVSDDPEVRIACYRVLIQSPISQTALSSLLQHIVSEPSVQVSAYCVEHLKQVVRKSMPRYQHVRSAVLAALPQLDNLREPKTDSYSRIFQSQMWDRLHQAGISVETDMVISDKAFTPRVSHIRFDHQAMGRNMPLLEITVRTEGLQRLLQKFFGPKGLFYSTESGIMQVLRRLTRRSSDYEFDMEMVSRLEVLPRLMKELPDLDLTVSVMGNDLIDIEASQKLMRNLQKMQISECLKSLSQMKKLLQPLISTFTMGVSAQVPTPVGTFLELNALMNFDFRPELLVTKSSLEKQEGKLQIQFSAPITVQNVQRIGSSMHVLEHFDLFRNELAINKGNNKMSLDVSVNTIRRDERRMTIQHDIPSGAALLKFKTAAKAVIRECRTDSAECSTIDKQLQHSRIAAPTTIRSKPQLINNILAPLSIELEVTGSVFSAKGLYQAPCWNLLGSAHYTVIAKQIDSLAPRGSALVYDLKLQGSDLDERRDDYMDYLRSSIWLQVSQAPLSEDREISGEQRYIMELRAEGQEPVAADAKTLTYTGEFNLFDQSSDYTKYSLEMNIQLPEDLQMQLRSLPLQSREWIQQRSAELSLKVKEETSSQNILMASIKASTNQQLMQLLQQSGMSHETLIRMFPRLRACVQEAEKSLTEAQKGANKMYTPSCIRQLRQFNQLSNLEFSVEYNSEQLKQCSACQLIKKPVEQLLQPYLVQYQPQYQRQSGMQRMTLKVQASPVDSRVMNVNASTPWAKSQWSEIQLPAQPFFWDGVENFTTAASDYVKGGDASCKLMNSHVKTFDGVVVSIPQRIFQKAQQLKCGVIVARDCSPSNLFNVRSYVTDEHKTVVVQMTRQTQIEVISINKSLDGSSNALVKWRNKVIDDPENPKPAGVIASLRIHYPYSGPAVGAFNLDIRKFFTDGQAMYEIIGREMQLQFVIGGPRLRTVQIRASPFYNNKMCGLCGDYNSEKLHEFKGTDGVKLMRSAEQLFKEYIEPDTDSCRELQQSAEWNTEENKPEISSQQQQQQWKRASHMIQQERTSPFFMNFRQKFSCKIVNGMRPADQQVVTISNAHIPLNSRIVKSIIQNTACEVKIAQTKIANTYVRVYLKPASEQDDTLTIQVEKFSQVGEDSKHQATFNSRTGSFELPSELDLVTSTSAIISEGQEVGKKLIIQNGNNHLTIRAFTNGEFDFQTTGSQMGGLCHLSSEHDIAKHAKKSKYLHRISPFVYESETLKSHLLQFATDYTSAYIDEQCAKQIRDASDKCEISQKRVQPFKNSPRSSQKSVQFLNNELLQMAVRKNVIIPLSVDKVMGESHNNVIALRFSSEGGKIFREFIVKFGVKTIATIKISQPFSADESSVTFLKNGEQRTIRIDSQQQLDIDNDMKVQISADSVKVFSADGYGIEVRKDGDQKVIITRPTFSTSHHSAGLCQISNDQGAFQMDVHPRDVLLRTMEHSLDAQDADDKVNIWSGRQRTHVESVLSLINPEAPTEQFAMEW